MAFCLEVLTAHGSDEKKWRDLVNNLPIKDIYFTSEYAKLFEMTEGKTRERFGGEAQLFFYGDNKNYIIHPLLKRKINDLPFYSGETLYDVVSPWYYGGPLSFLTDEEKKKELFTGFFKEFHNYCTQNNIITEFVRLHPILKNHLPLADYVKLEKRWKIVYVDLTQDKETIWNNFKKENRKAIRKAQQNNIEIVHTKNREDIEKSYEIYLSAMKKINADESYFFSKKFFSSIFELLGNNAQLFVAKHGTEIVAASVLLGMGDICNDYLRASRPEFLNMRPNNLLIYHIILWAKENGYKIFSLQGGQSKDDGILRFKLTFSDKTADYFTYSKIHNESKYKILCEARDRYDKLSGRVVERLDFFPYYRR